MQRERARKLKSVQELNVYLDKNMFDSDMQPGWLGLTLAVFADV